MKGSLFFLVLLIIGFILWNYGPKKEGFEGDAPSTPSGEPVIPLISPRAQTLLKGEVQPFAEPTTALLAPPPGQIASVGSRPAEDPASQKAPAGRIQSVSVSLEGFFIEEAPGLMKLGDASVQLPLSTARADKGRLKDELMVLKRNPGLESSLTQEDVDGIEANLAYLQKKWRQSVNALSGLPMVGGDSSAAKEGFANLTGAAAPVGPQGIVGFFTSLFSLKEAGPYETYQAYEGFTGGTTGSTGSTGSRGSTGSTGSRGSTGTTSPTGSTGSTGASMGSTAGNSDMTLEDLKDLSMKINHEILRLGNPGTTDLNTNARINTLEIIQKLVDDIKNEVERGIRAERDIPITKANVAKFLPAMTNPNSGISHLISNMNANPILSSLFPAYAAGDINGSELSRQMFDRYAEEFLKNLSYDITMTYRYKGQAEQEIASNYKTAMADAKFIKENSMGAGPAPAGGGGVDSAVSNSAYRGFFDSVIKDVTGVQPDDIKVGRGGIGISMDAPPSLEGGGAAGLTKFNWKERSTQICQQITSRGYNAKDFGCLEDPDSMKREGFSWRGHARMICNRLGTIYDSGVPELCGCPPPTWAGWRQ